MALVMQPQRPQGTLTVRWSRHGWQVYWKLANWQYLRGPQSSSMMHSWVGGEQLCQERQVSENHCVREGQQPLCPPVSASQAQGTGAVSRRTSVPLDPKPCPVGSWCPAPNLHPGRQGPHPLSTPQLLPCRMPHLVHKTASVCSLPAHTQGGEHRPGLHFSAEQMGLMKELMSSRLQRLHRRGWSPSQAGPAD